MVKLSLFSKAIKLRIHQQSYFQCHVKNNWYQLENSKTVVYLNPEKSSSIVYYD